MIGIIDYKAGNLTSVQRALDHLGFSSVITSDLDELRNCERIIFPGVGAAPQAMEELKNLGLEDLLKEEFEKGKPILGICLGTQIIFTKSEEGNVACLNLLEGTAKKFTGKNIKIPHMGWNNVFLRRNHPVFAGIPEDAQFYFVHSYYPDPDKIGYVLGITRYDIDFASVMAKKNLVAVQFHPEKSGKPGLALLKNFCNWDGSC